LGQSGPLEVAEQGRADLIQLAAVEMIGKSQQADDVALAGFRLQILEMLALEPQGGLIEGAPGLFPEARGG